MKRTWKLLSVVLLLLVLATTSATAQQEKRDPFPAYLFSFLVGFGTGHFYLKDSAAVKFLILDAAALAATIGGTVYTLMSVQSVMSSGEIPTGYYVGLGIVIAGGLVYTAARIWELVDIFAVVKEQRAAGKLAMRPVVELGPGAAHIGVALSY
jgi:hypothetical protein